jgi:hypothetical protein
MQGIVQLVSRHSGAHTCLLQTQPRRITPDFLTLSSSGCSGDANPVLAA